MSPGEEWRFGDGTITTRSTDVAFAVATDWTVAYADEQFLARIAHASESVPGADYAVVEEFVEEGRTALRETIEEVLQGESNHGRVQVVVAGAEGSGDRRPAEVRVTPLVRKGSLAGALVVARSDEAVRQRVEETNQRYRTLVEGSKDGVTITQNRTNVFANAQFAEMLGYDRSELVGEPFLKPIASEDRDIVEQRYRKRMRGESPANRYELRLATKAGDRLTVELHVNRIQYDGAPAVLATYRDVTERIERERLVQALDRVLRHNLRNRLNVVDAHATLIGSGDVKDPSSHVERIHRSVDALLETSRKGRDLIRFLSRSARTQSRDLAAVVHEVGTLVDERYPDADVTLDLPPEARAMAVPDIGDAVEELLTNAIEHNDQPTPDVSVEVTVDGEAVRVCVTDNGPGISEMERQMLDGMEDLDQLYHGSGFGLWLVAWIVRQSRGSVTIEDRTPRGSVVTLSFTRAGDASR